jgi:GDPmannose 4,6-dehydratase
MWRMLQQDEPDDYVLATGRSHSVREFMQLAFEHVGLDWTKYYQLDSRFSRPADPENLLGDATHAKVKLGWEAQTSLAELAGIMVDHDLAMLKNTGSENQPSN